MQRDAAAATLSPTDLSLSPWFDTSQLPPGPEVFYACMVFEPALAPEAAAALAHAQGATHSGVRNHVRDGAAAVHIKAPQPAPPAAPRASPAATALPTHEPAPAPAPAQPRSQLASDAGLSQPGMISNLGSQEWAALMGPQRSNGDASGESQVCSMASDRAPDSVSLHVLLRSMRLRSRCRQRRRTAPRRHRRGVAAHATAVSDPHVSSACAAQVANALHPCVLVNAVWCTHGSDIPARRAAAMF